MERDVEDVLTSLKVGSAKGRPAVHKPLLVLMLVARAREGGSSRVAFREVASKLEHAIAEFGPSTKKANAALPFWHLQSDGFWQVQEREELAGKEGKLTRKGLWGSDVVGVVDDKVWSKLTSDKQLASRVVAKILEKYLPASEHERIREAFKLR